MKEFTERDILNAYYEVIRIAMNEFIGMGKSDQDVSYLIGVHDLAEHLLKMIGAECAEEETNAD